MINDNFLSPPPHVQSTHFCHFAFHHMLSPILLTSHTWYISLSMYVWLELLFNSHCQYPPSDSQWYHLLYDQRAWRKSILSTAILLCLVVAAASLSLPHTQNLLDALPPSPSLISLIDFLFVDQTSSLICPFACKVYSHVWTSSLKSCYPFSAVIFSFEKLKKRAEEKKWDPCWSIDPWLTSLVYL